MPWNDDEQYYEAPNRNARAAGRYSSADRYGTSNRPAGQGRTAHTRGSGYSDSERAHSASGSRSYDRDYSRSNSRFDDRDYSRSNSRYDDRDYSKSSSRFDDRDFSGYGSRSHDRASSGYGYDRSYAGTRTERGYGYGERSNPRSSSSNAGRSAFRASGYDRRSDGRGEFSSGIQRSARGASTSASRAAAPSRSGQSTASNRSYANARRPASAYGRPASNAGRGETVRGARPANRSAAGAGFWGKCVWFFQRVNADVRGRRRWRLFPALYLPLACIYSELLLNLFNGLGLAGFFYKTFFGLSAGMLLGGFALLFKDRAQKIIVRVELFLVALLFIVQCLLRKEFQVYFQLRTVFGTATDVVGNYSSDLFASIFSGLHVILLFLLPLIVYWIMTLRSRRRSFAIRVRKVFALELILVSFLSWTLGMLTLAIGGDSASYKSDFEITSSSDTLGLLTGLRLSEKYALFGDNAADSFDDLEAFAAVTAAPTVTPEPEQQAQQVEPAATEVPLGENTMGLDFAAMNAGETDEDISTINTYLSTLSASKKNAYTGLFEGKNLILICAEALSDACIDPQLTPTLYRLMHNGFYFSQAYQPAWGGSTSSGEYSFLIGLVPTNAADTMKDIAYNNNYFTMGSQLNRLGYTSLCYHNGKYTYYDRNITHVNLGYDQFIAHGNGLEQIAGNYPNDEDMISKTLDTYIDRQPFSVYYMTCDGHKPYDNASDSRVTEHLQEVLSVYGDRYQQNTMNYICYQMELEDAMTTLVAKLEAAGIADDTVICICADHYPYGLNSSGSDYIADLYGYDPQHPWERDRNAIIIWSGSLENADKDMACEISSPVYSLDIVPTLSNLFGVEYDSRLLVGRDVFSDEPAFVLWNNGTWVTDRGRYDADEKVYYPITPMADDDAYVAQMSAIAKYKRSYSKLVKNSDYYQYVVDHLPAQTATPPTADSSTLPMADASTSPAAETTPPPGENLA